MSVTIGVSKDIPADEFDWLRANKFAATMLNDLLYGHFPVKRHEVVGLPVMRRFYVADRHIFRLEIEIPINPEGEIARKAAELQIIADDTEALATEASE
jgi:hypothetical protein